MIAPSLALSAVSAAKIVTSPTIFWVPRFTQSTMVTSSLSTPLLEARLASISSTGMGVIPRRPSFSEEYSISNSYSHSNTMNPSSSIARISAGRTLFISSIRSLILVLFKVRAAGMVTVYSLPSPRGSVSESKTRRSRVTSAIRPLLAGSVMRSPSPSSKGASSCSAGGCTAVTSPGPTLERPISSGLIESSPSMVNSRAPASTSFPERDPTVMYWLA